MLCGEEKRNCCGVNDTSIFWAWKIKIKIDPWTFFIETNLFLYYNESYYYFFLPNKKKRLIWILFLSKKYWECQNICRLYHFSRVFDTFEKYSERLWDKKYSEIMEFAYVCWRDWLRKWLFREMEAFVSQTLNVSIQLFLYL